jgi:hypothetical protein
LVPKSNKLIQKYGFCGIIGICGFVALTLINDLDGLKEKLLVVFIKTAILNKMRIYDRAFANDL